MSDPEMRDFRYERKFLVEQMSAQQIVALVKRHPRAFYAPYPPRYVNNLYLDTEGLEYYLDNVSGVGERRKARVRWYGDLFGRIDKPQLEFKIKSGLVGTKVVYPFAPLTLDGRFCHRYYQELVRGAGLPGAAAQRMRGLSVVLCNRYHRRYFASRDNRFRVTVDTEMAFYQVKKVANHFIHRYVDRDHVVVELKYDKPLDGEAEKVSSLFPFTVTRNSKYVTGIEMVYV